MTREEIAKLPKWAQVKVDALINSTRASEQALEDERAINSADNPATNVRVAYRKMCGQRELYLDDRETVEFTLPSGKVRVEMRTDKHRTFLRVNADDLICVLPLASNSIEITIKE